MSKQMTSRTSLTLGLAQENKSFIKLEMYFVSKDDDKYSLQVPYVA